MLDIGANRGLYIHHIARLTRKITAFEPLPPMQKWLRRNYPWLDLRPYALSDREGPITIRYPRGNYSWATIAATNQFEGEPAASDIEEASVEMRTLDSFDFADIGFIKIDVEGNEESVIAGASRTLASRPVLLIESEERHNPGSPVRLLTSLRAKGYAGLFVYGGEVLSADHFDPHQDQLRSNVGVEGKTGRYINNFIFVPEEDAARYRSSMTTTIARAARS